MSVNTILEDTFEEPSSNQYLVDHDPDINTTGNAYEDIGTLKPIEVVGLSAGYARSYDFSASGYGGIDLNQEVDDLEIQVIFRPDATSNKCSLYFGCDNLFENGWVLDWDGANLTLSSLASGSPTLEDSDGVTATTSPRLIVISLHDGNVYVDFNYGESQLIGYSYSAASNYIGFGLYRTTGIAHEVQYFTVYEVIHDLTPTGIVTTPVAGTPTLGQKFVYLTDNFNEASDTDLSSHSADVNNTGNYWEDLVGVNPMEVVGGLSLARSKYISSYITGWGHINLGSAVNNLDITVIMDGYANAYRCYMMFGADSTLNNGYRFEFDCAGGIYLYHVSGGTPTLLDSDAVGATGAPRTAIVSLSGSDVLIDFNSGESQLSWDSYSPDGQYVVIGVQRKDSGYHNIRYLNIEGDLTYNALVATGISTTPVVATPTLSVINNLTASDLKADPELDTPTISTTAALTSTGISTTPTTGTPSASEIGVTQLTSSSLSGQPPVAGTPSLVHVPIREYPYVAPPSSKDTPVYILDGDSLDIIGIIEDYYSLNWKEKYNEVGEFELELPIEYDGNPLIAFNNFIYIRSSDRLMIIEDQKPSISEDKASLLIKGRSSESIMSRRILIDLENVNDTAESIVYSLVDKNLIDADDPDRNISFIKSTLPTPSISTMYENQLEMQTLYEAVEKICKNANLGFKFVREEYSGSGQTGPTELAFYVYEGVDRSFAQGTNNYVIFSDNFDNVVSSSFYLSEKEKINIVLVKTDLRDAYGEEEDSDTLDKVFVFNGASAPTGMDRYETVLETQIDRTVEKWPAEVEAAPFRQPQPILGRPGYDILVAKNMEIKVLMEVNWSTEPETQPLETPLTDDEVLEIITTRGQEVLDEWKSVGLFEGDFDIYGNFKYGIDFFMGDIVQCNLEGRNVRARIVELVRSYSTDGVTTYLAFDFII